MNQGARMRHTDVRSFSQDRTEVFTHFGFATSAHQRKDKLARVAPSRRALLPHARIQ
jgi:hypothetical protein